MFSQQFVAPARELQESEEALELRGDAKELERVPNGRSIDHDLIEFAAFPKV